jgi:hypothetical protein
MRPFLRHGRISSLTLAVLVLVVLAIIVDSLRHISLLVGIFGIGMVITAKY